MKKMLLPATALALHVQDVLNRRCCSKQTGSGSTKTITHHSSFQIERKTARCSQKIWRRRKCLLKQKPSKHS